MANLNPDTDTPDQVAPTQEMTLSGGEAAPPTTIFPACASSLAGVGSPDTENGSRFGVVYYDGPSSFVMPTVGQSFLGFELLDELGRGTSGRVFLCKQPAMANRRVVLKVTKDKDTEVQTLARLKHTNIVPIYSAHEGPGFLAICMPYYGGLTFSTILSRLRELPELPKTGAYFVELLKEAPESLGAAIAAKTLDRMTYTEAVMWFGAKIAEGLVHAHDRGLVHCDLKPANILLADDGQPMLLDFDVALDLRTSGIRLSKIGGTLQYMSTDQLELLLESRKTIDRRSDLYSLGLVLFELLTGRLPFEPPEDARREEVRRVLANRQHLPPLAGHRSPISPTVEAIVHKCLAPKPVDRYPSAGALVDDIQRYFAFQPLRYAKVRSPRERVWRWIKRNPKLVSPTMLVAVLAISSLSAGLYAVQQQQRAALRETESQRHAAMNRYGQQLPIIQAAQAEIVNVIRQAARPPHILERARDALQAYEVLDNADWRLQPQVVYLPETDRERLETEIGTLLFLVALVERPDSSLRQLAYERAVACLGERAPHTFARYASDSAGKKTSTLPPIVGHFDRLLYACQLYATAQAASAADLATAYSADHPEAYLGWLLRGHIELELRRDATAVACYSACIAQRADMPDVYYRRGLAYFNQRDYTAARADFDLTLQFVPEHREARLFRAQTHQQMGYPRRGLEDLDYLLQQPDVPVKVYFLRARMLRLLGENDRAFADETEGMKHTPTDEASWVERGLSRMNLNPEGALDDFRRAEELNPRSFPALHNQAFVLNEHLHRPADAIKVLDRVLAFYPDYAVSLVDRAVLLARQGSHEAALRDVKRVSQLDRRPSTLYQMALVYAILAKHDASHQKMAMRLLSQAFRQGHALDTLDTSSDFDALRQASGYDALRFAVRTLAATEMD